MVNKVDLINVDGSGSQGDNSFDLRRSKRKKSVYGRPNLSENQTRNLLKFKKNSNASCLTSLPNLVLSYLLQFLDVESLESLSATCSLFDQLIAGRYLTSIDIPFSPEFVREMKTSKSIHKKPLLKLEFGKSKFICLQTMLRGDKRYPSIVEYLIDTQLSLLDLRQLREIDLVFNTPLKLTNEDMINIQDFYIDTFITPMGNLFIKPDLPKFKNITRLYMMTNEDTMAVRIVLRGLTNLIEFGLHIHAQKNLGTMAYRYYVSQLQSVVEVSRAHILKLTFLSETKKPIIKKLTSDVVERLEIEGPCTVNIVPVMKNLKEVIVKLNSKASSSSNDKLCTYWKSKSDDRVIHRAGLCCVNLGTTYSNCPKLAQFMGVDVSSLNRNHGQPSAIWNIRLKRKFYNLYVAAGGSLKFRSWCKKRWISKKTKGS